MTAARPDAVAAAPDESPVSEDRPPPGPANRLPPGPTCRVDLSRPLSFDFLGRPMTGFAGDTVASALYANGVRIFSRSLKYHRPRGLYSIDGESSNTYMAIDGVPNECAETTELRAGISVRAQNVRGDPKTDRFGFIGAFERLMPAGFYYRLFHRPYRLWPFFQNGLRRMAGTGVLDPRREYRPGVRAERYLNVDVAVVGGGTAGMAAALAAAERGLRVCVFERRPWMGGHDAWRVREFEGKPLWQRARELAARVRATENVRVFSRSPVTGVWGENLVTGFTVGGDDDPFRECHWECRASTVVVAAGCMDRPLVFSHNDRPGVMQPGAAWRLARTYGVSPGKAAVFSVGDDLGLEAAVDLARLGVEVRAVADSRRRGHDPALLGELFDMGIPFVARWSAARARGGKRVKGCDLWGMSGIGPASYACDLVVANAGAQPRIGVLATVKAKLRYCRHTHSYQPVEMPDDMFVAGSMTGLRDPGSITESGRLAGLRAAECCRRVGTAGNPRAIGRAEPTGQAGSSRRGGNDLPALSGAIEKAASTLASRPGPVAGSGIFRGQGIGRGAKAFVDLDEDGTYKNVVESAAQGFDAPELAKRFGGFGLGPGQYRVTGQNLAMIMAALADDSGKTTVPAPTTVRPPLVPPSMATLAGPPHDVHKRTPLHGEQAGRGAIFRRMGPWTRARYFSEDLSCRDEILGVRRNVGLLDSSPLGKFRVYGPDALNALQRVYISDMRRARPGRCMYSAMCNDMGHLMDDGIVVKEGENEYYFTTSSARAGTTVEWIRYHTRYDGWDYHIVNITDVLGSLNLAGPHARRVLERVTRDDVSNEGFPYMGVRRITMGDGVEARCLRLGFVGELSFELHVPSSYCQYVWDVLVAAGADFGIQPFGLEAQNCLRAEKGHIIIGAESEQRVTLTDIGMGFLWDREDTASRKVGAPALRACAKQPGRMKLVGLRVDEGSGSHRGDVGAGSGGPSRWPSKGPGKGSGGGPANGADQGPSDGAVIVADGEVVGYVCTTRRSETLGWQYGMALVREEHAVRGGRLNIYENMGSGRESTCTATVVAPHFYDPKGERLRS